MIFRNGDKMFIELHLYHQGHFSSSPIRSGSCERPSQPLSDIDLLASPELSPIAGRCKLCISFPSCFGNRLFNVQTIREMRIDNFKNLAVKKGFLSFYSVCMVLCVFVCSSVIALQTSSFNIGVWNFNIDTYVKISQNCIFYFF